MHSGANESHFLLPNVCITCWVENIDAQGRDLGQMREVIIYGGTDIMEIGVQITKRMQWLI